MHATGDGSVRLALDAIEAVRKHNGMPGQRHQVAHVNSIAESDIARFARLNVTAEISPMIWFPSGLGMASAMAIGKERADHMYPVKSLSRSGALVAGGSDWPVGQATPNPWVGIEGLVTRKNPTDGIPGAMWPEQAVDLATALRIFSINSAEAMGLGRQTGSIEAGKSADFIVLDRNLFKVPIEQVHNVEVRQTFFHGRQVFPSHD
jgi:predicted amidohydrolase YtcJ